MADRLAHRGPDDAGVWVDGEVGIALGHRRLSILDLSPAGHQPMVSASGRYWIVFNGEIYNHLELREELEDERLSWRGHSDTETLLAGFESWGIPATLQKTVGMFAIALWDRQDRVLTIIRDRIGEKPLYYGWQGDTFLFGSELKALRAHPTFQGDIDRNVLTLYLRHGYIPAPYSIFKGIRKLPPGTFLQLPHRLSLGVLPNPIPYWALRDRVEAGLADPFSGSDEEAIEELEARLGKAVSLQCIADVPLGAFLSGGIDSSTVVALMQSKSTRPVKTFTIGFHEKGFNEAERAKAIATYLGTDHTELYVTPQDAMAVLPKLPTLHDEPFGDSSAIPTFLVAQLARQNVTVSLSGDGGDELFGGYDRYRRTQRIWTAVERVPKALRRLLARGIEVLPGERTKALALLLSADGAEPFYRIQISQRQKLAAVGMDDTEPLTVVTDPNQRLTKGQLYDRMMFTDAMSYLPDDILVKVDRAAMGVGLETRVPMLDHRVVDFAWRLPLHMKVRNGEGKWVLRQVLYKYVPRGLNTGPKMGFAVPVDRWIRGPLRDWADDLLSEQRLRKDGFLEIETVRTRWKQHVAGTANWRDLLWLGLSFQAWLREQH